MRTREAALITITLLAISGAATAQEDPSVNESEFDDSPPPADESYLDEAEGEAGGESAPAQGSTSGGSTSTTGSSGSAGQAGASSASSSSPSTSGGSTTQEGASADEPTLSDKDFDMSVPGGDDAYLDEVPAAARGSEPAKAPRSRIPGFEAVALLAGVAVLALAMRRR